ncbi:MAG: ROK family protein [Oscillospiraceae bacterium]|jgi:glucokinase|nr:ROK family protein [Oscillospiraceae bacterium]
MEHKHYIGIDLGGTNIYSGVADENFAILGTANRKTRLPRGADDIFADIAGSAKDAVASVGLTLADVAAVGIGSPGSVNLRTGVVEYSNNFGFANVPLRDMLADALGVPAFIANDANAAAYGEFIAGAGRGTRDFVAVTLGTGVGGGVIIGEKLYTGFNDAAGELGHTVIVAGGEPCSCGMNGCAEAYVSATALIRRTRDAMNANRASKLWDFADSPDDADGKTAFDAAARGDPAAVAVVDGYIEYLAVAVTNYINIFQPERLALGGGVSAQGDVLLKPLRGKVHRMRYTRDAARNTEIVVSELGNDAAIIGAAMLWKLGEI